MPRVVYCDPALGAVGLTSAQARERGIDVVTATADLAQASARTFTYGKDIGGRLGLVTDRERGILVGAWVLGLQAAE